MINQNYRAVARVVEKMLPLVEFTRQFRPQQKIIRLYRADYDLLVRSSDAARRFGVTVIDHGREVWFQGLELTYDYPEPDGRGLHSGQLDIK